MVKTVSKCLNKYNAKEAFHGSKNTISVANTNSTISSVSKSKKYTHISKSKLIKLQDEICQIQDEVLGEQEKSVKPSCQLDEMKFEEKTPAQNLTNKELKLARNSQLLDIQLIRLKNKEKNLLEHKMKYSFSNKSKLTYIKEWTNNVGNINLTQLDNSISSNDRIENLTKSIC